MNNKIIFASNMKKYMQASGKSRKDICQALGISYFTVSDWVNGKKYPRIEKIEALANYFGIQKSDLIESNAILPVRKINCIAHRETMGERIKRLRIAAGMTQGELGALLGIKNSAVLKYECGMVENMKRTTIKKMADIFNVSPSYLLCFDDDNNKKESPRTDTSLSEKMFWENFVYFCNQHGYSPNKVASILGFSTGTVTWWKKGRLPHDSTLLKIADFFRISTSDLLSEKTPTTQFWENLINLCNGRGIYPNTVASAIGLSGATATKWKNGAIPHDTTLKKIADYFSITVEELLGQKEGPRTDTSLSEKMFWDTFRKLCDENHTSPNRVAKEFGLSSGSVTSWKNGAVPRDTTLKKIADYFSISVEELLGQKEIPRTDPGLSEEEQELIDLFRIVPADHQRMVLDIIHAAVGK